MPDSSQHTKQDRDLSAEQVRAAVAAATEPLGILGRSIPPVGDESNQATLARIGILQELIARAKRDLAVHEETGRRLERRGKGHRTIGHSFRVVDPVAGDVIERTLIREAPAGVSVDPPACPVLVTVSENDPLLRTVADLLEQVFESEGGAA